MHQASSFWQRWTSPASTSDPISSTSQSAIQSSSSPISELNATSDPTNDENDDISLNKDILAQVGQTPKTHLSPIDHRLTKENSRNNSASSGSSHQTFSSIPGPSDRPSPVQNVAATQHQEQTQQQIQEQQQQYHQQRSAIGSSVAASNSNEDFFFDRDPLLLPRRNHTIGAGTTPNRKRIHSHFLFPNEGPTSPGQNSLSAITGGRDTDDDEWEKMIKSREDLIPGEDDDLASDRRGYANGKPWQNNQSLAAASHHRRFPSQPSSVRAGSPYYSGNHSPLDSRGSYHQRSESARVRPLEQGPFASASTAGHSPDNRLANLDRSLIRRHQSLNYATGRAMSGRLQSSTRRNLYADRLEDIDRVSPTASLSRDTNISPEQQNVYVSANNMTPADRSAFAGSGGIVSPETTLGSSPSTSTMLSTSLLDAHARLSRMTLQANSSQQPSINSKEADIEAKRQLHSLITNRDMLERSTAYGSQGRRDIGGPVSASAYVPPIGHGHHRRDDSPSNSPRVPLPKSDDQNYKKSQALQGPFSAFPSGTPRPHPGSSLLNKPSMMGSHHLETAREESPRFDNNGFDTSQQSTRDDYNQSNADAMAMNIALLQQRLLSQQHQHHQMSATQMLQQPLHHQQQPSIVQSNNVNLAPLHYSMTDPRQPGHISIYNPIPTEGPPYRTYSPQIPHNLHSMFQPPLQSNSTTKGMPPSASQTISPALAARIAEKGYNPSPAQFDVTAPKARFFVIKSFTEDDVQRSLKHEIWASTEKGNQRLDRAFKECTMDGNNTPLYLFYSVNASGHFCGMAQMISPLDYSSTSNVWVQEGKWKGTFQVKWIFVKDVPNLKLRHIRLTNTVEQKPITQSRDTQELPMEGGREVLRIMAEYQSKTTLLQDWLFYEQQAIIHQQRKDGPFMIAS